MTCALQVEGSVPSVTLMDSWVELLKVVEMFAYVPLKLTPRKVTVQPDTNPLPVMVSVWAELEPVAGLGLTLLTAGEAATLSNPPSTDQPLVGAVLHDTLYQMYGVPFSVAFVGPAVTVPCSPV